MKDAELAKLLLIYPEHADILIKMYEQGKLDALETEDDLDFEEYDITFQGSSYIKKEYSVSINVRTDEDMLTYYA